MKTIIIDDERLARNELRRLLENNSSIQIIDEAQNAEEGIEKIHRLQPELIFLDIQMPGKNGFEMLEALKYTPEVIFTTAYDEYAIKAFEFNALDYLLKPIDPLRLDEAVKKIQEAISPGVFNLKPGMLTAGSQVFIKDGDKCWFIPLVDIRLFESVGNYAKVYFGTHKPLILKSLNALEDRLDEALFFRANRKHIINLNKIQKIDSYFNGGLIVDLIGGERIEISRRQAVRFKEKLSL